VDQSYIVLSVEHHFVLARLQNSYSGSFLDRLTELTHEFWGSTASFLILQEIAAKSSKTHQFLFFFFLVPHSVIIS